MKNFKFELQAKLSDGSDVIFDGDFVIGTATYILDAEGNKTPATDGEHELEGGQKFTTKDGMIESIATEDIPAEEAIEATVQAEETPVQLEETPAPAATEEVKLVSDADFQVLVQQVVELKAQLDSLVQTFELQKEQKLAEIELGSTTPIVELKESKSDMLFRKIEMFKS